jgi:hypothetical protein
MSYRDLDAYKVCHELALATRRAVDTLKERDPAMAVQLWQAALTAASRIARASAFSSRPRFAYSLNSSLAALSQIEYYLSLCGGLRLLDPSVLQELEGLRARSNFYVTKLLFSRIEPPPP